MLSDPENAAKRAFFGGRSPLFPACRRRRRALGPLARDILFGRGDARPLTLAAWVSLLALAALTAQIGETGWLLAPGLSLFAGLCVLALFDARYFVIPDGPLLWLVFWGLGSVIWTAPDEIAARLAAGALGFLALRGVDVAYESLRGAPGVGEGDARLFAVAGLWLGFAGLPGCLIYAALSALVAAVVALRCGALADARAPLPFGPHLALGLWLVWVFGPIEFG